MIDSIFLLFVGIIVGMFGTLVGVGGGFIVVPLLTLAYGQSPQVAVGTSLCIVALNALSGTTVYIKQHRVDYRAGIYFSLATIPGSFLGAYLLQLVSATAFDIGFGILILMIAGYMVYSKRNEQDQSAPPQPVGSHRYSMVLGTVISFFVGFVASMAGIGGGVVHVPAMIYILKFQPYIAIPTSHFILAISATFAAFSHGIIGKVAWDFVPFLGFGAIAGAQAGGHLSHTIKVKWILWGLILALVLVAIRLIGKHL
ncbi:MAG: sulfite exporter TauE/SafE family protein [Bacteroidota bacterium]